MTKDDKAEIIKRWLDDHKIEYYQEGITLSIDINKIPNDVSQEFHEMCYKLQKQVKK